MKGYGNQVQARLDKGVEKSRRNTKRQYLLSKRGTCSCGYKITAHPTHANGKVYLYYRCNRQGKAIGKHDCTLPSLPVELSDRIAWAWIYGLLSDAEKIRHGFEDIRQKAQERVKPMQDELNSLRRLLSQQQAKLDNLLELYLESSFALEVLEEKKATIDSSINEIQQRIRELETELAGASINEESILEFIEFAATVRNELPDENMDFEGKTQIFDLLDVQVLFFC